MYGKILLCLLSKLTDLSTIHQKLIELIRFVLILITENRAMLLAIMFVYNLVFSQAIKNNSDEFEQTGDICCLHSGDRSLC